jgi:Spy/CpxP family protein refolding chaperone
MKRFRLLAIAIFFSGLTVAAQQSSAAPQSTTHNQTATASNAEEHVRMLSEKLSLTADQQEKLRPIIQNMLDKREKLMRDPSLSPEQREKKERALHEKAGREARKFLTEEQNKKLDQLEAQHHGESAAQAQH